MAGACRTHTDRRASDNLCFERVWLTLKGRKMKRILAALVATTAIVIGCGGGSRSEVSYSVVTGEAHDCDKGPNASIGINNSVLKLTGTCERVLVKGGGNKITIGAAKRVDVDGGKNVVDIGAADIIRVNGHGNTINFKKRGVTKKTQDVVSSGDNNKLNQTD
jgi:hypothetical protein